MLPPVRTESPAVRGDPRSPDTPFIIERLQGWHLPLLDDPAFLPLHPLLQRTLLLSVPRGLASALGRRQSMGALVLVARESMTARRPTILGLMVARPLNRRGSTWDVEHLRLALAAAELPASPARSHTASSLLREAIHQVPGAVSWIASASSLDHNRLALLRENGFQPQRTERLWRWSIGDGEPLPCLSVPLQLRPLQRRNAPLLWHLEQATCPAPLRQVLDRRIDDLLERSGGHGWLLIDPDRNEAVAGARWIADHPGGGHQVELSVHPGWNHLLGPATELLLRRLAPKGDQLWLLSDTNDEARQQWLAQLGAEEHGDVVLMARSLWRRQDSPALRGPAQRISAVLEQLQPRLQPRSRSLPSPLIHS